MRKKGLEGIEVQNEKDQGKGKIQALHGQKDRQKRRNQKAKRQLLKEFHSIQVMISIIFTYNYLFNLISIFNSLQPIQPLFPLLKYAF